jgi:hypothetical protein
MTQRNPMNERYQTEEKIGKTRKSAASAKPVTKAASSVHVESSAPAPKGRMAKAKAQATKEATKGKSSKTDSPRAKAEYYTPDTPEYKKWRRIWWIAIGVAMGLTALSFLIMMLLPDSPMVGYVMLGLAYALLFFSIWIDLAKVRKIRNAYRDQMMNSNSKAAKAKRREAAEEQKKVEAEQAAADAKKKAAREARMGKVKGVFGGKKKADDAGKSAEAAADATADAAETNAK